MEASWPSRAGDDTVGAHIPRADDSQPAWAKELEGIAAGYGIEVRRESQLAEVDGDARRAVILDTKAATRAAIDYDLLHATPPQSAPAYTKATPLADPASPFGYVQVDKHTLQSPDWPSVFSLENHLPVGPAAAGRTVSLWR